MNKPQVGERWGIRASTRLATPLCEVELIQYGPPKKRGQRVRIKFVGDAYPGLDEWVPITRLVVPWPEAAALMQDELRLQRAAQAEPEIDETTAWAITQVFEAFGLNEVLELDHNRSGWAVATWSSIEAVRQRSLSEIDELAANQLAFTDRRDRTHVPARVCLGFGRRLCQEQLERVLEVLIEEEAKERRQVVTGKEWGAWQSSPEQAQTFLVTHLEPAWRMVRAWCGVALVGQYDEVAMLRAEVSRLRGLLLEQVKYLRQDRHPHLAKALESKMSDVTIVDA